MISFSSACAPKAQKMDSHFSPILLSRSLYPWLAKVSWQPLLISCALCILVWEPFPSHVLWIQNTSAMETHNYFLLGLRLSWLWKLSEFADITLVWERIGLTAENIHVVEQILLRKRERKTKLTQSDTPSMAIVRHSGLAVLRHGQKRKRWPWEAFP